MNSLSRRLPGFLRKQKLSSFTPRQCHITNPFEIHHQAFKAIHTGRCSLTLLSHLKSRGIVRLHGKDTVPFLQGLVTNDVSELHEKEFPVQYSFMLNVQGRILYDLFIFDKREGSGSSPPTLYVDVPVSIVEEFIATLRKYKLRKKVDILDVSDELKVWAQFSSKTDGDIDDDLGLDSKHPGSTLIGYPDPRVPAFGKRLLRRVPYEHDDEVVDESVYTEARYCWGIPEGLKDLPPGNCFPLESNAIFMNGVSFSKGCYIGQELTARTHYTGVTRKRLMPLVFQNTPPDIEGDATLKNAKGRSAGKLRGCQGRYGLGLVRLAQVKEELSVTAGNNSQASCTAHVPHWWPELQEE